MESSARHLKLVEALRSNDLPSALSLIEKDDKNSFSSPLHLAVTLSTAATVSGLITSSVVDKRTLNDWIVSLNDEGDTPVHIAAKLGRLDVLELLFKIPGVNETIRNFSSQTPVDLARSERISAFFVAQRNEFNRVIVADLWKFVERRDVDGLIGYFKDNLRASAYLSNGLFDINGPLEASYENSLMHYAALWESETLLDWCFRNGADPNVRNRRGKKPIDLAVKHSKIRERLKTAVSQTTILSSSIQNQSNSNSASSLGPPAYQGILQKWTNYAVGYKSRYFVLENGILSYYKSAKDYPSSCRGFISMKIANISLPDSSDKSRFDIVGNGDLRFSLKARTPTDAKKWIWTLMDSKRWVEENKNGADSSISADFESVQSFAEEETSHMVAREISSDTANEADVDDIELLLQSLRVQLKSQEDAINLLVRELSNQASTNAESIQGIPQLVQKSSSNIISLVTRVSDTFKRKEEMWRKRFEKQVLSTKRWEDIVAKVLDEVHSQEPSSDDSRGLENQVLEGKGVKEIEVAQFDEEDDDEVFFDAQDDDDVFVASRFDPSAEYTPQAATLKRQNESPDHSKHQNKQSTGLVSASDIEKSIVGYSKPHRDSLPLDPSKPKPTLNIWSFIKSAIGKDLTKITLPVFFNEPLSMLQRLAEDVEYIELLSLAASCGNRNADTSYSKYADELGFDFDSLTSLDDDTASMMRQLFVAAFGMSNYSSTVGRLNKPFNPMLVLFIRLCKGETYEFVDKAKKFRYVAEQVCHHPPISACWCESPEYQFWAEVNVRSKFWGKSIEILPLGTCHVNLPVTRDGNVVQGQVEHFSWRKVTTCVNNVIVGKLWIDHFGDMVIKNWRTGTECLVRFKPKPTTGNWFWKGQKKSTASLEEPQEDDIEGSLFDADGNPVFSLAGRWDDSLSVTCLDKALVSKYPWLGEKLVIWKRRYPPENSASNFNFTSFAVTLNDTNDELDKVLPPNDARKRQDQRAMEKSQWENATAEKERLEKMQRKKRDAIVEEFKRTGIPDGPVRQDPGIPMGEEWWTPRWFVREKDEDTQEEHWKFTGDYWSLRGNVSQEQGQWPSWVPDPFGRSSP